MDTKNTPHQQLGMHDVIKRLRDETESQPYKLLEILYEYLSEHISTHFEKTIEGIDTLHSALRQRQQEHEELLKRLDDIEQQVQRLETILKKS